MEEVIAHGPTKVAVRLKDGGIQCDLRLVSDTEYPYALHHFTGSKEHHIALRNRALERGWSINEYRISAAREKHDPLPDIHDEQEFYRALGMDYIAPELRENLGEIEAAATHALPELIEPASLRGTFHCHTNASDGHNTLEEMASAAHDLGLQYLGLGDHSKSSFQANGQDETRLAAQGEAIRRLNAQYKRDGWDFRLFAGVECDIMKDGTLDFSDEVLASLDYVVVSVHNAFTLPEAEMTRRLIRAMENPYVTMMGHLTGRLAAGAGGLRAGRAGGARRGGGDGDDHRTQREHAAAGHGLALVASGAGKGRQMRDQPGRAPHGGLAGFVVRRGAGAQGLADARGRGQYLAARADRTRPARQARADGKVQRALQYEPLVLVCRCRCPALRGASNLHASGVRRIGDGLGGFVVEATAALTIRCYLLALRLMGRWNQPFSGAGFGYSVLTGLCVGAGTVRSFCCSRRAGRCRRSRRSWPVARP